MNDVPTGAVRVWPATEAIRDVMRHPNGTRFRKEMGESVEWPNDAFTKRRIADGDVRLEGAASGEPAPTGPEGRNVRELAAARRPQKAQGEQGEPPPPSEPQPQPPPTEPQPPNEPQPAARRQRSAPQS